MRARFGTVLLLAGCLVVPARAEVPSSDRPEAATVASWSLASPFVDAEGLALWVLPARHTWRVEIAIADGAPPGVDDLLQRRGRGWTLARHDGAPLLIQAWGEPWREAPAGFADAFADLLDAWRRPPAAAQPKARRFATLRPRPRSAALIVGALPAAWRLEGDITGGGGDLRRELTARGRGRGGRGLRLTLRVAGDGAMDLDSVRWPGRLRLGAARALPLAPLPAEAFLPVWSLAELGIVAPGIAP